MSPDFKDANGRTQDPSLISAVFKFVKKNSLSGFTYVVTGYAWMEQTSQWGVLYALPPSGTPHVISLESFHDPELVEVVKSRSSTTPTQV